MAVMNRFNLIDEPWVPVAGHGLASLAEVFSNQKLSALGGNPIQKIALTKLLLAIAQAAYTPEDDADWKKLGAVGMAKKSLEYLKAKKDLFWLYGERPFLQMPEIVSLINARKEVEQKTVKNTAKQKEIEEKALPKSIGSAEIPDMPSENNTILMQNQSVGNLTDADRAVFLVSLMNFALGGKRVEKDLAPFSLNYLGKTDSAKSGPSIGNYVGYLHSFLMGETIIKTLWINLLTYEQIKEYKTWTKELGVAPWEQMPAGEDCDVAKNLKNSYMGCLVSFSRFVLMAGDGLYYVEGIQYPSHKNGWREPTMAISEEEEKLKLLWVNPEKKPWRELTAMLSFVVSQSLGGFDCRQIRWTLDRAKELGEFKVWSGGLKVRGNAGDQSVKQEDDFVESEVQLYQSFFNEDSIKFTVLKREMAEMENLSKIVYGTTMRFFKAQKSDGKKQAGQASNLFWQLCERKFQKLVDACGADNSDEEVKKLRREFAKFVDKVYDTYCPRDTARQLDAWASNKPNLAKYLA